MATEMVTALGTVISVEGTAPATFDAAGFGDVAMIYDEVTGLTSADGDLGFTFNVQTTSTLKDGIQKSAKGVKVFNPITLVLLDNTTSLGRTALETSAALQRDEVSLKIVDADSNIIYLCGIVSTNTKPIGNADNIVNTSFIFTPNYEPVYV